MRSVRRLCWALLLVVAGSTFARVATADIFQWEWIDPLDPSQGRQESTTLAPDGAGRDAVPGARLDDTDLTQAWLSGANLTGADLARANLTDADLRDATLTGADLSQANLASTNFVSATLTGADISQANLTGADFWSTTLTGADFTGADVRGASFWSTTDSGFTAAQLYSTASYQAGDLSGIRLGTNDLTGWNFAGQNLTDASFSGATLTGADFTGADVRGTGFSSKTDFRFTAAQLYSTASYQAGDLSGIRLGGNNLTGWSFAGQNLTDAGFSGATLIGADFTDAEVRGARFRSTTDSGFTAAQLYSTASYRARDLSGIELFLNDLTGWNFAGQNLTAADFGRAMLARADFTGADTRDAAGLSLTLGASGTQNTIFPDGMVYGLDVRSGETVRLWDYDSETALPIEVQEAMQIDGAGTLRIVIEDDTWGSTLTFEPRIDVRLDGTLQLVVDLDEDTMLADLVGTPFDLFDWTGVAPTGRFAAIATNPGLMWDTAQLYTTGQVTLAAVPEPATLALALVALMALWSRRADSHHGASRGIVR